MIDYLNIPLGVTSPDLAGDLDPDAGPPSTDIDEVALKIRISALKNARLVGSEPLAHPRLTEVIGLLRVNSFQRLRVQTGGWPLRHRKMCDPFFRMGIRLFEVRFLSSRKREHDRLAGRNGSFAVAWAALKRVRKAGKEMRGGGPTFIEARIVVTPQNLATLERTLSEASRWPVHQLAVVPGRQHFSLLKASVNIQRGIEHAIANKRWVYLERWPACLFPKLELHLRELTRKLDGRNSFLHQCEGCMHRIFCGGVPDWFRPEQEPLIAPVTTGHNWGDFHAHIILEGA